MCTDVIKGISMKHVKKMITILALLVIGICGCSSEDSTDAYMTKVYELSEEEVKLVTNPSPEYVVAALNQVDSVIGVEIDPEVGSGVIEAAEVDECVARIFFTSDLVDQAAFGEEETVLEKGTSAGGSIDVYMNVEDALARDVYLHGFDDNALLKAGGHAVVGTMVIRTSEKLSEEEQIALTDRIVEVMTSGNVADAEVEEALIGGTVDRVLPEMEEEPTPEPTEEPTPEPTEEPTPIPTEEPTPEPTEEPTPLPTEEPTPVPTEEPTPVPTEVPISEIAQDTPAAPAIVEKTMPSQDTGAYAVNGKNGKIHIVGACTATKPGSKSEMKNPIYFNSYE